MAHSYTDSRGRSWSIEITPQVVREVQDHSGLDLANMTDVGGAFLRIGRDTDAELFLQLLWHTCRMQALSNSISFDEFCSGTAVDDVIEHAFLALEFAIIDLHMQLYPTLRDQLLEAKQALTSNAAD